MQILFSLQALIEQIEKLCKEEKITISQMLSEADLNSSVIDNMKKGSIPSIDKIAIIASYFGVSTDSLLGNESLCLSDTEQKLLVYFRSLNQEQQESLLQNFNVLL